MKAPAVLALAFVFAAASLSSRAAPALDYTVRGAYLYTENLGRASGATDFRDTSGYETELIVGASRQLASGLAGRVQLEASYEAAPDYDLLAEGNIGPRASLQKKFGLGVQAPVLAVSAATLGRFARIDENDGVTLQGAVALSKRFNPFFSAQLRGEWQEHVADAATFDVHHYGGEARLDFDPTDRARLSIGGGYRSGTFTAGASAARFAGALAGALGPEVAAYYTATPKTVTDAFQPGWVTYRVEGDIDYFWIEFSPALTDSLSLAIRYERNHATNSVDVQYRQDIFSIGALYRF